MFPGKRGLAGSGRSVLSARFVVRFAICTLLTAMNISVIAMFGGTLLRATVTHLLWLIEVALLLTAVLASLVRGWMLTFRGRLRQDRIP